MSKVIDAKLIDTKVIDAKERNAAINPESSYLVQAPAGSGKTELLIQRILALLARIEQPEEILALTFTRKAAAEMRERVVLALQKAKQAEPQETHAKTTWKLAKAALLQSEIKGWRLTAYPAQLRIMTIDAFASGLARQLPILSGFGQAPTTADFTEPLYQSAVHDFLQYAEKKQAPEQLQQAVNTLILHLDCNIEKLSSLLCMMLSKREQWLPDVLEHTTNMASFRAHLEGCLETVIEHHLFEAHQALPHDVKGQLPALAHVAATQLINANQTEHTLAPLQGITTFPKPNISSLNQWKALIHLLLTQKQDVRKSITIKDGFPPGKDGKIQKDALKELWSHLESNEKCVSQLHHIRSLPNKACFETEAWDVLNALFIVLKTLSAQLWHTFEQHRKVDFVEVMLRAKQALGQTNHDGDLVPSDALLRLDYQIKHILIDEFQDTSTLQIDLLARLTAGWDNDGRTLFIVGDPMQSIYRFRKAEVSLFLKAANNTLHAQQKLPHVSFLKLSQNFRSSPDIVQWVNRAFTAILPKNNDVLAGAIAYTPSQAFKTNTGQVKLNIFSQRDDKAEAEAIIKTIHTAKQNGDSVGILAKGRNHLHSLMLQLQDAKISFRALDILPLHQQSEIIDLRTLTCALAHPADCVAWAALLRSPAIGLSLTTLFAIFNAKPLSPWQAVQTYEKQTTNADDKTRLNHFIQALTPAISHRGRFSLRNIVESTWLKLNVPTLLSVTQLANVDAFFELLQHIENEGTFDIILLDQRLEKLYAKPESQADAGQVELLTMHSAKGLQWDTVLLPGLGKTPRAKDKAVMVQTETNTSQGQQLLLAPLPKRGDDHENGHIYQLIRSFEAERDSLETARLLYVACTRAERELHLFGHVSETTGLPLSSSLLALLWQDSEACYGATILHHDVQPLPTFGNLAAAHQHIAKITPNIPPLPAILTTTTANPNVKKHQPEFSWAGATAKAVGIALHAALQRLAETGIDSWSEQDNHATTRMMQHILQREGISQAYIKPALQRCTKGLQQTLHSTRAQWILSPLHQAQHNEWALTYVEDKHCKHIVLDRSFIDEHGTRWVIDYKTGWHQDEDLDNFLDQELKRYTIETPQLPNYVKALQALEPERDIKAALYFPMVDGWRIWK